MAFDWMIKNYADKDLTISPNIFEKDILMIENEFRQKTSNSNLLANYGFTRGYKSSVESKKKNISHLFGRYKLDLGLENYNSSEGSTSKPMGPIMFA